MWYPSLQIMSYPDVDKVFLLTPWCTVLLEQLTGLQLVKKFPAFHGTRKFITALTNVRHLSLSWASSIQSIHPHPTSWRSILILSSHPRLGLPIGLLPSYFPSKTLYAPLSSPIRAVWDKVFYRLKCFVPLKWIAVFSFFFRLEYCSKSEKGKVHGGLICFLCQFQVCGP